MNCKQGDLAIIISSRMTNSNTVGCIVTCLEFVPVGSAVCLSNGKIVIAAYDAWIIDKQVPACHDITGECVGFSNVISDFRLSPLRDNDGEDETIKWAGKPVQEKEFIGQGSLMRNSAWAKTQDLKRRLK